VIASDAVSALLEAPLKADFLYVATTLRSPGPLSLRPVGPNVLMYYELIDHIKLIPMSIVLTATNPIRAAEDMALLAAFQSTTNFDASEPVSHWTETW
jgi:hypothetical protein